MNQSIRTGASAPSAPAPAPDYRFSGYGYQNWCMDGPPPIVVNPQASLHAKLAWCWGELNQLEDLGHTLCTSEDEELARVGNLLASRVMPLLAMLDHLSEDTRVRISQEARHA